MSIEKYLPVSDRVKDLEAEIERLLEASEGEITPEVQECLEALKSTEYAADLANRYHHWDAECRAVEARIAPIIESLQADLKHVEQRRDRVKQWLMCAVPPGATLTTDAVSLWYRESTAVDVIDPEAIPLEFTRVKTEPDKRAIGEALKAGTQVPGAQLVIKYNLQIELPGERAKANAKAREKRKAAKNVDLSNAIGEG